MAGFQLSINGRIWVSTEVLDEGKSVGAAARDLDLTESSLCNWAERGQADRTHGR
jgi:transposase-like protein